MGQRTKKSNTSATTWFIYDENDKPIAEYDVSGNLVNEYVYLNDRPIANLRSTGLYYIYTDHLQTPRAVTDTTNKLVWTWENSEAFGNSTPNSTIGGTTFTFNLRFSGQYFDTETNLNYNLHRDYNPNWGRYMESDPLGLAAGISTYGYVGGNSLNYIDKLGFDTTITIVRDTYTSLSITGTINVTSDVTDQSYSGYTLENAHPANPNLPVSQGVYLAFLRTNHEPNRIQLKNVLNAKLIQIHNGNDPDEFKGCFGVGNKKKTDHIADSVNALKSINKVIAKDGTGNITVIVIGGKTGN